MRLSRDELTLESVETEDFNGEMGVRIPTSIMSITDNVFSELEPSTFIVVDSVEESEIARIQSLLSEPLKNRLISEAAYQTKQIEALTLSVEKQLAEMPQSFVGIKEEVVYHYKKRSLEELRKHFQSDSTIPSQGHQEFLANFLQKNWALINGTMLSYTALPDEDITQLMLSIGVYVGGKDKVEEVTCLQKEVACLMPTLTLPENFDFGEIAIKYDNVSLNDLLHTHILGGKGTYLIPLSILKQINDDGAIDFKLKNVFYGLDGNYDEALAYLGAEEVKRLVEYSDQTMAIYTSKQSLDALSKDDSNLLGQLNKLASMLHLNSVNSGLGSETVGGQGGELAIHHFVDYYKTLEEAQKNSLSIALKTQLRLLHNCVGDYEPGEKKPIPTIETCFATRRTELLSAMQNCEAVLESISLSGEHKASQVTKVKSAFDYAVSTLLSFIDEKKYEVNGSDKLSLTNDLLAALEVPFSIINFEEMLGLLKTLTPGEMSSIFITEERIQQVLQQIQVFDGGDPDDIANNCVILAINLSPAQLDFIFNKIMPHLKERILDSPRYIFSIMLSLDNEKRDCIIASILAHTTEAERIECFSKVGDPKDVILFILSEPNLTTPLLKLLPEYWLIDAITQKDNKGNNLLHQSIVNMTQLTSLLALFPTDELKLSSLFSLNNQGVSVFSLLSEEDRKQLLPEVSDELLDRLILEAYEGNELTFSQASKKIQEIIEARIPSELLKDEFSLISFDEASFSAKEAEYIWKFLYQKRFSKTLVKNIGDTPYKKDYQRRNAEFELKLKGKNFELSKATEEQFKLDKWYVFSALSQNANGLKYTSTEYRNNLDIVLRAVEKKGEALQYASNELRNNQEIVTAAIEQNPLALEFASHTLKNTPKIVLDAIEMDGYALRYASDELKDDFDIVMKALERSQLAVQFVSKRLLGERAFLLLAVKLSPKAIKYASDELRGDPEVVLEAIKYNRNAFIYSEDLRNDRMFILAAVKQDHLAFKYATEELKSDIDFILELMKINHEVINFVSEKLKNDPKFILKVHAIERTSAALMGGVGLFLDEERLSRAENSKAAEDLNSPTKNN